MPRVASPVLHLEQIVLCVALVPLHLPPAVSPRLALRSLLSAGSGQLCSRAGRCAVCRCVLQRAEEGGKYTRLVFAQCMDSVRP